MAGGGGVSDKPSYIKAVTSMNMYFTILDIQHCWTNNHSYVTREPIKVYSTNMQCTMSPLFPAGSASSFLYSEKSLN